jgi:hypothetical protein
VEDRGWAAWMGFVACNEAREVNTAGNPVHFTGLAWAGEHGRPLQGFEPREVTALSGACMALPLETFRRLGGFPEPFFLYHEDIDLSMRLRLEGERVGLEPAAAVDHDYEFEGPEKMRWLERNRWAFVLRVYPAPLLVLLAPVLLLTELVLIPISIAGGWGGQKMRANLDGLRRLPWTLRTRRAIQRRRSISAADFAAVLTADLDSPYFGRAGRSRLLRLALRAYWRVVRVLLLSQRESGVYETARGAKKRLERLVFERGLIDTGEGVRLEEFGLDDPERVHYEASAWSFLRRALRHCKVGPTDVFVDFGSGKGRVVWQAAQFPFARVVGVEISPQLNAVARRNIEKNLDRLICRNVELITADATEFEIPDDMTFAYFYFPFKGEIFGRVIRRVIESIDRNPRRLTLIYANPVMDEELRATGRFELVNVLKGIRPDVNKSGWVHVYEAS